MVPEYARPVRRARQVTVERLPAGAAVTSGDVEAYHALYGDDAMFVWHATGAEMGKPQFAEMIRKMMASDKMKMGARR